MNMDVKNCTPWSIVFLLVIVGSLSAQSYQGNRQEFLDDHEVELIREAQDPNLRIHNYLKFASMRIALVGLQLDEYKPGHSKVIHRKLREYGRIIETIDLVIDDALERNLDITPTIEHLVKQQEQLLTALEKIVRNKNNDYFRYKFVLEDVVEITQDSMELLKSDLGDRKIQLQEAATREITRREASMVPDLKKEIEEIRNKEKEKESKRPSLLRPGEKLDRQ